MLATFIYGQYEILFCTILPMVENQQVLFMIWILKRE